MITKKSSFFIILYFVQGVALAYFTGFQKRYLASRGVDSDLIALLSSLVILPFILKPFVGLVADSFEVKRKAAIALGLGLAALAFGLAMRVDPGVDFLWFSVLMISASIGVTIFDTIADALAVDAFAAQDFGSLQSAMLAGKSLGLILFSVVFGVMIDRAGYQNVFVFLSVAMFVPFLIWHSVQQVPRKERFEWRAFRVLTKDYVYTLAIFGVVYSIPSFGVSGLFAYYFSELGFGATQVGWLESAKSIGAVAGAVSFAALLRRYQIKTIAIVATLLAVVVSAAVPFSSSSIYLYLCVGLFGVVWALRETVFTTLAMRITQPAIAATMFSLIMAFSNLGTSIGEGWATASAGRLGFGPTFILFGLLNILGLWYFGKPRLPNLVGL